MPHMPRPPSVDHGVISFLWAVGLGAYVYFGSLAVGISAGTAFIFAAKTRHRGDTQSGGASRSDRPAGRRAETKDQAAKRRELMR